MDVETVFPYEDNGLSCGQQMTGSDSLARHFEEFLGRATRALDVALPENLTAPLTGGCGGGPHT